MTRYLQVGLLILFLLVSVSIAGASLALTNVVYSWDYAQGKYQNSNVTINADGGWQPFVHQFIGTGTSGNEFDTMLFVSPTLGINTRWAGVLDYAVNITDTNGIGQGFQTTRNWSLVLCDRTKDGNNDPTPPDGDFGNTDLSLSPPEYLPSQLVEFLPTVFQNQVATCANGTCSYQLVTRLIVNLDKNNDGAIDAAYLNGTGRRRALCFYAEAKRPSINNWNGNLQARISDGGGDKTVNFRVQAATSIRLSSFEAKNPGWIDILLSLIRNK